ncbi:MAG: hypothetical protein ACTSPI_11950 [Candidatus Heimdallarchaeaceae archaeon]
MKRKLVIVFVLFILVLSFTPVLKHWSSEWEFNAPVLLNSVQLSNNCRILLGSHHSSEAIYQNNSFEFIADSFDVFSDINGERPFPWGGEIFHGKISFLLSEKGSYSGERCFEIIGYSRNDHGAIAIPDLPLKPDVEPGELYHLSFWVRYNIQEGGFRLTQQFFRKQDGKYPNYACHGTWIKGNSNECWEYVGLLVRAPMDSWKGDPVLELKGKGCVFVDDAYFGKVEIIKEVRKNEIL